LVWLHFFGPTLVGAEIKKSGLLCVRARAHVCCVCVQNVVKH